MTAQVPWYWPMFLVIFGVLWVLVALHTALGMRAFGRRWWVWFLVSVFLTLIPATIVCHVDSIRYLKRRREEMAAGADAGRCRHCGGLLGAQDLPHAAGHAVCPNCGMIVEDEFLA